MKKRLLAFLLTTVMLFGMIPVMASAESAPQIKSANLALDSILSLNITADLAGEAAADYTVSVTIGDDIAAQVLTSENGIYTAKLLAHRMHESVRIELKKGDTVVSTKTWTLEAYLTALRQDYFDESEMLALVDALANYGSYADYYADETLNGLEIEAVAAVKAEMLDPYKLKLEKDNTALKANASLYLAEACDLIFKFDAAAMEGKTLYIDGQQKDVSSLDGGKVGYTIPRILPQDWDAMHQVVVKDGEEVIYQLSYGVLSYARQGLSRTQEQKADLNGLLASMYLYNGAADEYVTAKKYAAYEQVAENFLTLTPASTSVDDLPGGADIANVYSGGWTQSAIAADIALANYSELKFYTKTSSADKYFELYDAAGNQVFAANSPEWAEVTLKFEQPDADTAVWTLYVDGQWRASNFTGTTLSDIFKVTLGGTVNADVYVTDLLGIPVEQVNPYEVLADDLLTVTGKTAGNPAEGFTKSNKLNMTWNNEGVAFAERKLDAYKEVKFAVRSIAYHGLNLGSDAIAEHSGGQWIEYRFVRNGGDWDFYMGGELKQTVTLPGNNLSALTFRLGGSNVYYVSEVRALKDPDYVDPFASVAVNPFTQAGEVTTAESLEGYDTDTYYVTNLRALADPEYVPMVYTTVSDSIFDIAGTASEETIDGYETVTALTTSWNKYNFHDFDLTPYIRVKFAVKSSGWFGLMPDANTVIHESNGTVEIELVKKGTAWEVYYNGNFEQEVTLANNNLTDLNFRFGGNTYHVSELKAVADPDYVAPKVGIIEMDPFTLYGTLTTEETIEGYNYVTALSTSWNKYNFVNVDLTNYTEVWFAIKSSGYYGVMATADAVIGETNNGGSWMKIRLVKNGASWDIYYGDTLKQTVTLANNNLSDLNFRFGTGTFYVTELMGMEDASNPYVSDYVQVAENLLNNTPTSTSTEALPSRDVTIANITHGGWASPGVVDGIKLGDYTELKFWYKVSDTNKWFEMYDANGAGFYQGHATSWTEMKFQLETNGTWTLIVDGTGKKWGLSGTTLKDVITTLTLGGSAEADVYVTDLIGIISNMLPLVENSSTDYSVVYENGSGEAFAAEEFTKYFDAATGLSMTADVYTADASVPSKAIVLGAQPAKDAGLSFAALDGPSDYIITNKNAKLYIYGNTEQGTVNGVYAFLEEQFGLDVFYKDTYTINTLEGDLILEPFTTVGNAKFDYLFAGYGELRSDMSEAGQEYSYMMGTVLDYTVSGNGIHNALTAISQEEFGAAHPEWFYTGTTADGYNTGVQLYLAVDDFASGEGTLVSAVADKLYTAIVSYPDRDLFGFSPMDIDIWPTGEGFEKSDALKAQYGTNAAEYILFMNAVAQELEKKLDGRQITLQLLAYNKTLVAPADTSLSLHNGTVKVVPYIAPVESNFHMAFTDSRNLVQNPLTGEIDSGSITVGNVIEGWDALADELHLWWYSVDAYSYFMPVNTYDNMGENYQFAYEHGVNLIFHQSQFDNGASPDWSRMKIYLHHELAKDPYADVDALIEKFMNAYFGAGAENMKKLMDSQRTWYSNLLKNSKQNDGSYWLGTLRGSAWCTQDSNNRKQWTTYQLGTSSTMLTNWVKYCNNAKTAINNDSSLTAEQKAELCSRVDLESLSARYVLAKVFGSTTYDASLEAFLQYAKTLGVTSQGEGNPIP